MLDLIFGQDARQARAVAITAHDTVLDVEKVESSLGKELVQEVLHLRLPELERAQWMRPAHPVARLLEASPPSADRRSSQKVPISAWRKTFGGRAPFAGVGHRSKCSQQLPPTQDARRGPPPEDVCLDSQLSQALDRVTFRRVGARERRERQVAPG